MMNNREAIALLRNLEDALDSYCELNEEGKTAFRMAIESLELFGNSEHLPSAQPDLDSAYQEGFTSAEAKYRTIIDDMKAAQSERKKGKWIDDGKGLYMCSSCGKPWVHWWARVVPPNQMCKELRYCPMCGADMRGDEE